MAHFIDERSRRVAPSNVTDDRGRPSDVGRKVLEDLIVSIRGVLDGHEDNTGSPCRIDLSNVLDAADGHDCCYHCNIVGAMMRAAIDEMGYH